MRSMSNLCGTVCAIAECRNIKTGIKTKTPGGNFAFFRFPKDPSTRKAWIIKCKRQDKWNPEHARICSHHFRDTDFERDLKAELMNCAPRRKLKPGVVPSINLNSNCPEENITVSASARKERAVMKAKKLEHENLMSNLLITSESPLSSPDLVRQIVVRREDEATDVTHDDSEQISVVKKSESALSVAVQAQADQRSVALQTVPSQEPDYKMLYHESLKEMEDKEREIEKKDNEKKKMDTLLF